MKFKNKVLAFSLSAIMAVSALSFTGCKKKEEDDKTAYVSLDINPAIELVVDKNNKVISVRGENEDGQVLLYQESGIKGENVDVAIQKITQLAISYGYLDENNAVVDTLVTSSDEEFKNQVLAKVETSVTATADSLGLTVKTDLDGAYSLLRRMEEIKAQYPNNEAIQNMTVSKFKLALSVSETGDVTFEAAVNMNEDELIKQLTVSTAALGDYATKAYVAAKDTALAAYDKATDLAVYGVYTKFYLEKILSHPTTAYYGGMYQVYATASKSIEVIAKLSEIASDVYEKPLTAEQIVTVTQILGLDNADVLKNSKGEVTIESIEAYADKVFKNSEAGAALEAKKAQLTQALNSYESAIRAELNKLQEEYKPQIEAAITAVNDALAAIDAALPESLKTFIGTSTAELKEIVGNIKAMTEDGTITVEELKNFAKTLGAKADEYLAKINADLTEEELKDLEDRKTKVVNKMTVEKAKLENALDKAEQEAKAYLQNLKHKRIEISIEVS